MDSDMEDMRRPATRAELQRSEDRLSKTISENSADRSHEIGAVKQDIAVLKENVHQISDSVGDLVKAVRVGFGITGGGDIHEGASNFRHEHRLLMQVVLLLKVIAGILAAWALPSIVQQFVNLLVRAQ